jgi:Ca2+-binding RTX toxin-like protein
MTGGSGNDSYEVDNPGDVIVEVAGGGIDTVTALYSGYVLPVNFENLWATGTGSGNGVDNIIYGSAGVNVLNGLGGNDTLNGGAGDTMVGGTGNDVYMFGFDGYAMVVEAASEGTDTVNLLSDGTYITPDNVENVTAWMDDNGFVTHGVNIVGNALDNFLQGDDAGNRLDGGAGADLLAGSGGDDIYIVDNSGDTTYEGSGFDRIESSINLSLNDSIEALFLTGSAALNGTGGTIANLLRGNSGANVLIGGGGVDVLEGGDGQDTLSNSGGRGLLFGGAGADSLTGASGSDVLIGGAGNDSLATGTGADLVVFNKGDGQDTVAVSTTRDNTVSIGGGAVYVDLLFQKNGNDLILSVGSSDQITFTDYYANSANRSVNGLQVVIEGTADYSSGSSDALRNKKIETFNFEGLFQAFETARAATPGLTSWALTNALLAQHLSGNDTAAIGGDLAYHYGRNGNLSDISFMPAVGILGAAGFGSSVQTLQSLGSLQDATARLS